MYISPMILRLEEQGSYPFKEWIARQMPITHLAEKLGISSTAAHEILSGKYKRSKFLPAIAEVVGAKIQRDREGRPVFIVPDPIGDPEDAEDLQTALSKLDPETRQLITAMIDKMSKWREDQKEAFRALVNLVDQKTNQHQEDA